MHRIHLILLAIAGLLVVAAGLVASAPASFAVRLLTPSDSSDTATVVVHNSGMSSWEVAGIAIAAAALAMAGTFALMRIRLRRAIRPTVF